MKGDKEVWDETVDVMLRNMEARGLSTTKKKYKRDALI